MLEARPPHDVMARILVDAMAVAGFIPIIIGVLIVVASWWTLAPKARSIFVSKDTIGVSNSRGAGKRTPHGHDIHEFMEIIVMPQLGAIPPTAFGQPVAAPDPAADNEASSVLFAYSSDAPVFFLATGYPRRTLAPLAQDICRRTGLALRLLEQYDEKYMDRTTGGGLSAGPSDMAPSGRRRG